MKKLYGDGHSEYIYDKKWWMDAAYDQHKPVIVFGQKREVGGDMMWCDVEHDFCLSSEQCGKRCPDYTPCNGKNGRCTELKACFIETGIKYRITEKGSVRRV